MTKLIGILSLLLISTMGGCDLMSHTHCDDKILTQEKSVDGRYVAVLYHRSCANKTGLYTCVNLQEASTTLLSKGEAEPILTIRGFHGITAIWIGPNSLQIRSEGLNDQKAILTQHDNWKDIRIFYKIESQ